MLHFVFHVFLSLFFVFFDICFYLTRLIFRLQRATYGNLSNYEYLKKIKP